MYRGSKSNEPKKRNIENGIIRIDDCHRFYLTEIGKALRNNLHSQPKYRAANKLAPAIRQINQIFRSLFALFLATYHKTP